MESESDNIENALREFDGLWYWWTAIDAHQIHKWSSKLTGSHFQKALEYY
jgi:hypothetical protein